MIGIENGTMEFHVGDKVSACQYRYAGHKILTYTSGKKGVRYLFECQDAKSEAPKFVQFSDHIIGPRKSSHFHIFMGNQSQEALLAEMDNDLLSVPVNETAGGRRDATPLSGSAALHLGRATFECSPARRNAARKC